MRGSAKTTNGFRLDICGLDGFGKASPNFITEGCRSLDEKKLHFTTGFIGWLARFFVGRRASGDPYEMTLVLPALLVIGVLRLDDLKKINDLWVVIVLFASAVGAGATIGSCLGISGSFRALLRGISAGAIEAASHAAISETLDRSNALIDASSLITINMTLYWYSFLIFALIRDFSIVSEAEWHSVAPRRALIYKIFRIVLRIERLEGASVGIAIVVWAVWLGGPVVINFWCQHAFGVSISDLFSGRIPR